MLIYIPGGPGFCSIKGILIGPKFMFLYNLSSWLAISVHCRFLIKRCDPSAKAVKLLGLWSPLCWHCKRMRAQCRNSKDAINSYSSKTWTVDVSNESTDTKSSSFKSNSMIAHGNLAEKNPMKTAGKGGLPRNPCAQVTTYHWPQVLDGSNTLRMLRKPVKHALSP